MLDIKERQLQNWIRDGVVPTLRKGQGRGNHHLLDLMSVVAIACARDCRRLGLPLRTAENVCRWFTGRTAESLEAQFRDGRAYLFVVGDNIAPFLCSRGDVLSNRQIDLNGARSLGLVVAILNLERAYRNIVASIEDATETEWSLKFVTVASLELTGRALWWVTQESGQRVILHIPTSWIVSVDARRTVWKIRPNGSTEEFPLPGNEVVHFFYPDPADPLGAIAPLSRIAEAVLTDEEISTAQWKAFRNGIFPKVVLTAGRLPDHADGIKGQRPVLSAEQRQQLIAAIKGVYQGTLRADEPFIVDGLIESITKLSNTIAEMDFINSAKLTKSKVLQGFGVSPILLGEVEGANRASATVADEIFCACKINPLIELLSQSMTAWLGPMFASPNEKLCVWIDPAIANDPELDLKRWELAGKLGAVTKNEFRRRVLNLKDLKSGDEILSRQNWSIGAAIGT